MSDPAGRVLWATGSLSADERRRAGPRRRVDASADNVERGLVQLVLTLVELLRQLMERQAIRRMEAGSLTLQQEEDLGRALMRLAEKMDELKEHFDLEDDDLNLSLGPLGDLL